MDKRVSGSVSSPIAGSVSQPIASSVASAPLTGFRGLLVEYSGASAGYSLRKIGSGPVVRLRRASDNAEKDFTAGEVVAGTAGSELVTNGGFDTDSDWTKGSNWTITGGQAVSDGTLSYGGLRQDFSGNLTAGAYYILSFDIVACSNFDGLGIQIEGSSVNTATRSVGSGMGISSTGTYSVLFLAGAAGVNFAWWTTSGTTATIDNVSFKPYTTSASELWSVDGIAAQSRFAKITAESAYATTWYDQSGSGNDATQSTAAAQPLLIRAGVTATDNGKAALEFDGVDDVLSATVSPGTAVASVATVWNKGNGNNRVLFDGTTGASAINRIWRDFPNSGTRFTSGASTLQATNSSGTDTQNLTFIVNDGVGNGSIADNGETPVTGTMGTGTMSAYRLGGGLGGLGFINSYVQELVVYQSDQSANRTGIETNINDHYGIY